MNEIVTWADGETIGVPVGGVPVIVAVFLSRPASRIAWVTAALALAIKDCPGNNVPGVPGQA
ncbi:hypothetical protein [Arthrobacter sp. NA-172]|uniref:hypothetical protein n=1 Tax=Arthrobacter sp. NA-172 TaxID=3367524 RepID=UPI003754AD49